MPRNTKSQPALLKNLPKNYLRVIYLFTMREQVTRILADKSISDIEYAELLLGLNRSTQEVYFARLHQYLGRQSNHFTITTPGSDGRGEKASVHASPAEFTIFYSSDDIGNLDFVMEKTRDFCGQNRFIESKGVESTKEFLYCLQSFRPERVLDSYSPQFEIDSNRRLNILNAFLNSLSQTKWKKTKSRITSFIGDAVKTCSSGENKIRSVSRTHFDLAREEVSVFYNPKEFQLSFKPGPLRLVQYGMVYFLLKKINRKELNLSHLEGYPFNTMNRLDYLFMDLFRGSVERDVVDELKELYAFFMRLYHKSELSWEVNSDTKFLQYSRHASKQIKENLQSILKIRKELFSS